MSKNKIIVPSNCLDIKYRRLGISKQLKNTQQWKSPFINKDCEYIVDINKDSKKHYSDVSTTSGIWNFLGIKGDLTINVHDVDTFNMYLSATKPEGIYLSDYGSQDYIYGDKLTINSDSKIYTLMQTYSDVKLPLKELNINCKTFSGNIEDFPELEKIKINTKSKDSWYVFQFSLRNCPKLKELDISTIAKLNPGSFRVSDINDNCIIKLNPNVEIEYYISSPFDCCQLNEMFSFRSRYDTSKNYKFKLADLLNINDKSKPIEIKAIDLKKLLTKYSLEMTQTQLDEEKISIKKQLDKLEKYASMSPEEAKKQKLKDEGLLK